MLNLESSIFNSELEFREQIILNYKFIDKIFVFADELDKKIYFYCFLLNGNIFATKETLKNNFSYYNEIYKNMMLKLELNVFFESNKHKVLRLEKN